MPNKNNKKIRGPNKTSDHHQYSDESLVNVQRPLVSICTPTFNRRPFIPYLIECVKHQTYPLDRIEWVIVDDGTDPIGDLVKHLSFVKYIRIDLEKIPLGKKRNLMHTHCTGDFLVYMDDDDYYPRDRVSHAVEMLQAHPASLIAGSSEMHIYFGSSLNTNTDKITGEIYQCGPYGTNVATAATFAFRRELLDKTRYNDADGFTEEPGFLQDKNGNKEPVLQLDPLKTILVISHPHNSLNKEHMLRDPEQFLLIKSRFKIEDFIQSPILVDFYIRVASYLLDLYEPGKKEHKPQLNLNLLRSREAQITSRTDQRISDSHAIILKSKPYCQMKKALEAKIAALKTNYALSEAKNAVAESEINAFVYVNENN